MRRSGAKAKGGRVVPIATQEQIWAAVTRQLPRGRWVGLQEIYRLVESALQLSPEDHQPEASGSAQDRWQRNVRNVLQRRKTSGDILWDEHAEYMLPPWGVPDTRDTAVSQESGYRTSLWGKLNQLGVTHSCPPMLLWELRIHRGEQGIYRDAARTSHLTPDGSGVTVSVLHLGRSYPDDLGETELLYHYPRTDRPKAYDEGDIQGTKDAARLGLPVFAILPSHADVTKREVHLAWVEDWDDASGIFLISFGESPSRQLPEEVREEPPFYLEDTREAGERVATTRPGQQRFKFSVLKRYGAQCAVCGIAVKEVLDAVHIRPRREKGSDDARNGLVLCASHHRAFDAGLFAIQPDTLVIRVPPQEESLHSLRITAADLSHLDELPAPEALRWRWQRRDGRK